MSKPESVANQRTNVVLARVRLFASYREAVGDARLTVELPEGARVSDLMQHLRERHPRLRLERGLVAVNQEYVGPDFQLHDQDEVAFIPPVSGGA